MANLSMAGVPSGFSGGAMPPPPPPGSGAGGSAGAYGSESGSPGGALRAGMEAVAIDEASNCSGKFMRMTVGKVPHSDAMAQAMKCPLGLVLTPMALDANLLDENECPVDVVNFGKTGIVRCKRCRTYVNPFVAWVNNGRQWRCNICGYVNEVPHDYFSHLTPEGERRDKAERPELCNGSVELVAPSEYMLRPPQAPVYLFVVDVSAPAVASGAVAQVAASIKACLDALPGQPRTQVGFLCVDAAVHFFNLKASLSQPQMLTVPDLAELFLPLPDDLLVNLAESRGVVDALLDALPLLFAHTRRPEAALGPALVAAYRIMSHIGGKMCVFLSSLPSAGEGSLKQREDLRKLGGPDEHHQLNPADEWYKTKAVEFHRLQICVDLFLFGATYADVATLKELPKYTAGTLCYYPAYQAHRDGPKFDAELRRVLCRSTGFEAVMRVRATRGLRITHFHGNFSIRGTDLLALPNCHPDASFAIELVHDDALLSSTVVSVQGALLYTTSGGERRIRVHNLAVPVSGLIDEVAKSVDIDCLCNILARQALDTALKTGLESARLRLQTACVDILRGSKPNSHIATRAHGIVPGQLQPRSSSEPEPPAYPEALQLLPLYTMALQKSVVFRGGTDLPPDERSFYMMLLNVMSADASRYFVYPRMFALHNLPSAACMPAAAGDANAVGPEGGERVTLPPMQNLSAERLSSDGVFMLENTVDAFVWVGAAAAPAVLQQLFGLSSVDQGGDFSGVALRPAGSSPLADKVARLLTALMAERGTSMRVFLVREGDPASEARFFRYLVEDRASFQGGTYSYGEFMALVGRQTR
jgi:protein transport protein SEC24